jgi:hypothetical protein
VEISDPITANFTAIKNLGNTSIAYKPRLTHTHTHPDTIEARNKTQVSINDTATYRKQLARGAKIPIYIHTNCHLGLFPWLLVFQGVCGCACALVCMRYLCFPSFNSCEVCSGWVICCHRCLTCFKGLCCVCTQVSGSVVSN